MIFRVDAQREGSVADRVAHEHVDIPHTSWVVVNRDLGLLNDDHPGDVRPDSFQGGNDVLDDLPAWSLLLSHDPATLAQPPARWETLPQVLDSIQLPGARPRGMLPVRVHRSGGWAFLPGSYSPTSARGRC